jgi:hypothetical protein
MRTSNAEGPNSNDQKRTKLPAPCNDSGAQRTYGPLAQASPAGLKPFAADRVCLTADRRPPTADRRPPTANPLSPALTLNPQLSTLNFS